MAGPDNPDPAIVRGHSLRDLSMLDLAGLHKQIETELAALGAELDLVEAELNARS